MNNLTTFPSLYSELKRNNYHLYIKNVNGDVSEVKDLPNSKQPFQVIKVFPQVQCLAVKAFDAKNQASLYLISLKDKKAIGDKNLKNGFSLIHFSKKDYQFYVEVKNARPYIISLSPNGYAGNRLNMPYGTKDFLNVYSPSLYAVPLEKEFKLCDKNEKVDRSTTEIKENQEPMMIKNENYNIVTLNNKNNMWGKVCINGIPFVKNKYSIDVKTFCDDYVLSISYQEDLGAIREYKIVLPNLTNCFVPTSSWQNLKIVNIEENAENLKLKLSNNTYITIKKEKLLGTKKFQIQR